MPPPTDSARASGNPRDLLRDRRRRRAPAAGASAGTAISIAVAANARATGRTAADSLEIDIPGA